MADNGRRVELRRTELGRELLRIELATIVLFVFLLALGGFVWYSADQQAADIRANQHANCVQTYEGIRLVFLPFFPPKAHRTPMQQANWDKFNRTITRLKGRC